MLNCLKGKILFVYNQLADLELLINFPINQYFAKLFQIMKFDYIFTKKHDHDYNLSNFINFFILIDYKHDMEF